MSRYGYSGSDYDRYAAANADQSTISKMKETYWTTKQAVMTKLGKKQDEHIVASDAELDAKLEVFRAIQLTSIELLRVIERYQDRICILSREENAMGRLLKVEGGHDKTRAGKMMTAVGKAQCFSSQQLLGLRAPLVRLYQEVETFRYRAIADTLVTINKMEGARTEYRGNLMWMKDISEELDPDTSKQLQKFRTVQMQVKKSKAKFDKLKLDSMQKIDLLAASRCNMFSQVLAKYQTTLLLYWTKTSARMSAVAQSFKGYQYYEFSMLKELGEPSKKLADETGGSTEDHPEFDDDDEEGGKPERTGHSATKTPSGAASTQGHGPNKQEDTGSLNNLLGDFDGRQDGRLGNSNASSKPAVGENSPFIDFADEEDDEDVDLEEMKRKQDEEFGLAGGLLHAQNKLPTSAGDKQGKSSGRDVDLLSEDLMLGADLETDDLRLFNELLNVGPGSGQSAGGADDFENEWASVFGSGGGQTLSPERTAGSSEFMPSCLLDTSPQQRPLAPPSYQAVTQGMALPFQPSAAAASHQQATDSGGAKPKKKNQKQEMSAWFNLFAELDPLSDPDAIGRNKDDLTDA